MSVSFIAELSPVYCCLFIFLLLLLSIIIVVTLTLASCVRCASDTQCELPCTQPAGQQNGAEYCNTILHPPSQQNTAEYCNTIKHQASLHLSVTCSLKHGCRILKCCI